MGIAATALNLVGLVFLSHAVYSAYEHSLLPSSALPPPPSSILPRSIDPKINLPLDITLETLFAILVLCVGVVLSSSELKPIQWSVWSGGIERSTAAREIKAVGLGGGNPFANLEERPGFWDARKGRAAYKEWADGNGKS